jgi:hypothetical protein
MTGGRREAFGSGGPVSSGRSSGKDPLTGQYVSDCHAVMFDRYAKITDPDAKQPVWWDQTGCS